MQTTGTAPKIAFVHDWLVTYAGAERVLEQMLVCFPEAEIFSLVDFLGNDRDFIQNKKVHTSFIQRLPFAKKYYRQYLALLPVAVEQFDLSSFDIVISSSHAVAKGVLTGPDQLHLCMCYSPVRYAWDLQHQYLAESNLQTGFKSWVARLILHYIRVWDYRTANGVDDFIAISRFISRRINKCYGRSSTVIYPPVDTDFFQPGSTKEDFYVTASRMVPYKRIDLIVSAFAKTPARKLIVIGDGPDFDKIKGLAAPNIALLGRRPGAEMRDYFKKARAFIFAAEEDFGIAPLEAQACGTPVVAFGKGGALETIVSHGSNQTGMFFDEQTTDSLNRTIDKFEELESKISPESCRLNAERFSPERFGNEFETYVTAKWSEFNSRTTAAHA